MKKHLLLFVSIIFCYQFVTAQKASIVLENSTPVKKGHRIFLKYDTAKNVLKVDATKKIQEVDFTTLEDSSIFLVRKNEINVFLKPLNPINFSCNTETKIIVDPVNEAAANAFSEIFGMLDQVLAIELPATTTSSFIVSGKTVEVKTVGECEEFIQLKEQIDTIQSKLKKTQKDEILVLFKKLESISFINEDSVIYGLKPIRQKMNGIEVHFKNIESLISDAKDKVKEYSCDSLYYPDAFTVKYLCSFILRDFTTTLEEQEKRFTNLQNAYRLVEETQQKASIGGETNELEWCIPLDSAPAKEGKITVYTVTVKQSGYSLSDSNEIVSSEPKDLVKKTFRVRRFQRFIPEVSVGTAFTFLEYNTYGTTTDSLGQITVGSPTKNSLRNLNITTMVNFNYYIPNSPVHPLFQFGLGINSEIPSLLAGLGLRSNINGIRRMTISGGLAMNWIRELQTLEKGSVISGTDDIDKDFRFSAAPTLTGYVGIQYNF